MQIEHDIRCEGNIAAALSVVCGVYRLDDRVILNAVEVGLHLFKVLVAHRSGCGYENREESNAHLDVFLGVADDPIAVVGLGMSVNIELERAQSVLRRGAFDIDLLVQHAGRARSVKVLYTGGSRG